MHSETRKLQNETTQDLEHFLEMLYREFAPFKNTTPSEQAKWRSNHLEQFGFGHRAAACQCLKSIQDALDMREISQLASLFEELFELSATFGYGLERDYEKVENWIELLSIKESEKLFEAKQSDISIPELLVTVNEQLLKLMAKNPHYLYELEPRKFEELIAELFFRQGFEVQLTKSTRDGGRDIVAFYRRMNISTKYLIECKRYAPNRSVGIEFVQRLFGAKMAERENKAILATTSCFTKPAIEFANNIFGTSN